MNRRDALVTLVLMVVGSVRAAEPEPRTVRVGFVHPQSPSTASRGVEAFWGRLTELGYVEGQNLAVERRWAEGRYDRLPDLIAEVIGRKVDVLVVYTTPAALAAKKATGTIPIVAVGLADPIRSGLAPSLGRPSGNLTGLSTGWDEAMAGKWLELLQETVPRLSQVAVIANTDNPAIREQAKELEGVSHARGVKVLLIEVREPGVLDAAFEQARRKAQGILVLSEPTISAQKAQVIALAAKNRIPTFYNLRDFVSAGGFIAYSPDFEVMWGRAADYVDKMLKGAKPAELPIELPTQYRLSVNLKTAKALRITIPESILLRADEVIK